MSDVALLDTEFVHNTDLNPSEAYIASLPRLRAVLRFEVCFCSSTATTSWPTRTNAGSACVGWLRSGWAALR